MSDPLTRRVLVRLRRPLTSDELGALCRDVAEQVRMGGARRVHCDAGRLSDGDRAVVELVQSRHWNFIEAVAEAVAKAKASGKPVRMDEAIDLAETELADRRRQAAQRARLRARARWTSAAVSPFDVFALTPARERGWDSGRSLTDKQRALLDRQGIDPGALTYTQGRQLLTEIFRRWDAGLCSYKQARVLRKYGYDGNVSRDEASIILDRLIGGRKHGNPHRMATHKPLPAMPSVPQA